MDVLQYNLDEIERWLLMFFRVSSIFMVWPIFGFTGFPTQARIALAFMVTIVLFPVHPEIYLTLSPTLLSFFATVLHEIFIGLAIGMVGSFLFYGVQFAGQVIGQTSGLSMISVLDPMAEAQVPIIAQLLNYFGLLLFLSLNGHHFLLEALNESFRVIPIGTGSLNALLVQGFARFSADIFILGIKIGAPVLIAILVTEVAMGIVARTVPQMNVWIIGFPLKIGIGLLTLSISLPFVAYVFGKYYTGYQGNIIDFIRAIAS